MADQKSSQRMGVPQYLLGAGMLIMVIAAMIGAVVQGTPLPRYVALVAVLFIAAGGVAALVKKVSG